MAYGRWHFHAHGYEPNSQVSRIHHWQQVEKSLGRAPQELKDKPSFPDHLGYLWEHYVTLKNASEGAVSFEQIQAFCQLTGEHLLPWEVEAIRALDTAHSQEQAKTWQKK